MNDIVAGRKGQGRLGQIGFDDQGVRAVRIGLRAKIRHRRPPVSGASSPLRRPKGGGSPGRSRVGASAGGREQRHGATNSAKIRQVAAICLASPSRQRLRSTRSSPHNEADRRRFTACRDPAKDPRRLRGSTMNETIALLSAAAPPAPDDAGPGPNAESSRQSSPSPRACPTTANWRRGGSSSSRGRRANARAGFAEIRLADKPDLDEGGAEESRRFAARRWSSRSSRAPRRTPKSPNGSRSCQPARCA